jgi:hypothetical protein
MAEPTPGKLLAEGLTDAVGFVAGGLVGFGISRVLGWDLFAAGFDSMGGILLSGLGAGGGVQLARRWRARRQEPK